ncbi:adhesin [Spirosoma fluminis]
MINLPTFDQDDDVLMLNPDPETAAFDDDDEFDEGADFDELGSGATSGYGEDDLGDIDDEAFGDDDDLSEELDDDIDDDLDDDSMD